jgi:uracil-DNA glycosylase family 4
MFATGKGEQGIFILAEAPGRTEDSLNVQLVGKAGKLLRGVLHDFNIDLDQDCRKMNAVNCRPTDKVGKIDTPLIRKSSTAILSLNENSMNSNLI